MVFLYPRGLAFVSFPSKAEAGQTRIACVGDSITYGHRIEGWPENSYPSVLQQMLGEQYHVNNYGASGFAVQQDADLFYGELPRYQNSLDYEPDIVVFMMGSNDSKPQNWAGEERFRQDLLNLLDSYGDAEIILCTPAAAFFLEGQTEGVTEHNIQPLIVEEIAEIIRQVAEERGYTLVDIHAFTAENPQWFASDGVHPDAAGAAAIAREIFPAIAGTG